MCAACGVFYSLWQLNTVWESTKISFLVASSIFCCDKVTESYNHRIPFMPMTSFWSFYVLELVFHYLLQYPSYFRKSCRIGDIKFPIFCSVEFNSMFFFRNFHTSVYHLVNLSVCLYQGCHVSSSPYQVKMLFFRCIWFLYLIDCVVSLVVQVYGQICSNVVQWAYFAKLLLFDKLFVTWCILVINCAYDAIPTWFSL